MTMTMGQNTVDGSAMMLFVQRVEDREKAKKIISDEIAVIYAQAKAEGYSSKGVRSVVAARKQKPSQFRENEDVRDIYFHAAGLAAEPPLFRSIEALAGDAMGKAALIESMSKLVPVGASIVVEMEGLPVRISRGEDGTVRTEEVQPQPKGNSGGGGAGGAAMPPRAQAEAPNVTSDAAKRLGAEAFRDDKPITANPFPFGDKRQPVWDEGWREASGTDGMGPDEDEK